MEDLHEFFGMTIKNARMDCDLTQEALAKRAGISCRYLIAIENEGRDQPQQGEHPQPRTYQDYNLCDLHFHTPLS